MPHCQPRRSAFALSLPLWVVLGVPVSSGAAPAKSSAAKAAKPAPTATPAEPAPEDTPSDEPTTDDTADEPTIDEPPDEPQAPTTEPGQSDIASPVAEAPVRVDQAAVDAIETEARAVSDELFKARARVATVASKLFRSKIELQLRSNLERFYEVSDLVISVDGAPVVTHESGVPAAAAELFQLYAAPGAHELSFSAKLVARRDATYKLRISQTFTVFVPEESTVSTKLVVRETGNMWRFTKRNRGRSRVDLQLRARAKPNERGRKKVGAGAKAGASTSAIPSRRTRQEHVG